MLQRMMGRAEAAEVAEVGGAAAREVMVVVDLTASGGDMAAGEPAALVSGAEEPLHAGRGGVPVDLRDHAALVE